MRHTLTLTLISLTLLTASTYADEFNSAPEISYDAYDADSRQGFMGGLGIGYHRTSFDNNLMDTESSVATSIKIGYNFTEQLSLQYVRNVSWYSPNDDLLYSGIMGIGATYYFQPLLQTAYVSIVAGLGDYGNIDNETSDTGSAFMATVGYEFSPHWQAEASWLKTSIDYDYNDLTIDSSSIQLLINYSWY